MCKTLNLQVVGSKLRGRRIFAYLRLISNFHLRLVLISQMFEKQSFASVLITPPKVVIILFFLRKSLEICSSSNLFFCGLAFFFKFGSFPLLKRRQTPLSNSKSVKVRKNLLEFHSICSLFYWWLMFAGLQASIEQIEGGDTPHLLLGGAMTYLELVLFIIGGIFAVQDCKLVSINIYFIGD